jgi:hypothetical protein
MPPKPGDHCDMAPFGRMLADDAELRWEDPREVHRVVATFPNAAPSDLRLLYWRTRWPQQRLPKDRVPAGGRVGWWETGNWFTGAWQAADAEVTLRGATADCTFRPIHEREFPEMRDFPALFRTTLRLRFVSDTDALALQRVETFTDSTWARTVLTVLWAVPPPDPPAYAAFNGHVEAVERVAPGKDRVTLLAARNADPNSCDKTLLTLIARERTTVLVVDAEAGPVCIPDRGVCVVAGDVPGDYLSVFAERTLRGGRRVHEAVAGLPEQSWRRAWDNMVPKREPFYLPLAADGARHKFGLNPNGSFFYRTNNRYLVACPGADTPRLEGDADELAASFCLPATPTERTIADGSLPVGDTTWAIGSLRVRQTAFATVLDGTQPHGPPPPGDACGVCLSRFEYENQSDEATEVRLPLRFSSGGAPEDVHADEEGVVWAGARLRAVMEPGPLGRVDSHDGAAVVLALPPRGRARVVVKLPYVALDADEARRLAALDFDRELAAVSDYWRRRLDEGMRLITPEQMLNEFHRAHAGHLLINCEREPGSERRFARVGSFRYGAFGNESCMMIGDLDRRGYHREARECLDAFRRYQGTVGLPGDFDSPEGVLYGAHGYECGGYNQHHGWILWCLVEHFRFTRDDEWLRSALPNVLAGADWIMRQRARTRPVAGDGSGAIPGLMPHGSLEDIGDWWQWLSTNVYTWRGLDAAAWALEQSRHDEAERVRREADDYRASILHAFRGAADRAPVVQLRDGLYVPHYPSHAHRRGRTFGWICETLEGAIHLLIGRVVEPRSREAECILNDYEDNLYLNEHYGYHVDDLARDFFHLGGFSLQACLLLDVEPYLYRDEVRHALRAAFNAIAAYYFPDTRMLTEHALVLGEWRGDHYKSSDEANAAGWLRYLFVREEGDELLLGQATPRDWQAPGQRAGVERAATHFGPMSLIYIADEDGITAALDAPTRNPPACIRLRFRPPADRAVRSVRVNGRTWGDLDGEWVLLPGDIGRAEVRAAY